MWFSTQFPRAFAVFGEDKPSQLLVPSPPWVLGPLGLCTFNEPTNIKSKHPTSPPPTGGFLNPKGGCEKWHPNFPSMKGTERHRRLQGPTNLQLPNIISGSSNSKLSSHNSPSINFRKVSGKDLEPVRLHPITSKWINSFKSPEKLELLERKKPSLKLTAKGPEKTVVGKKAFPFGKA